MDGAWIWGTAQNGIKGKDLVSWGMEGVLVKLFICEFVIKLWVTVELVFWFMHGFVMCEP